MYKNKGKDKKQRTVMIHYTVMYGNVCTKKRKGQETKDFNDTLHCNVWQCTYKNKGKLKFNWK